MVSRKEYKRQTVGFKKQRSTMHVITKLTTKNPDGFRKKEKTAVIFFNIENYLNN